MWLTALTRLTRSLATTDAWQPRHAYLEEGKSVCPNAARPHTLKPHCPIGHVYMCRSRVADIATLLNVAPASPQACPMIQGDHKQDRRRLLAATNLQPSAGTYRRECGSSNRPAKTEKRHSNRYSSLGHCTPCVFHNTRPSAALGLGRPPRASRITLGFRCGPRREQWHILGKARRQSLLANLAS